MKPYFGGIRHNYKNRTKKIPVATKRHWSLFLCGLFIPILAITLFFAFESDNAQVISETAYMPEPSVEPLSPLLPPTQIEDIQPALIQNNTQDKSVTLRVGQGETLEELFRRHNLSLGDLSVMARLPQAADHLRILLPGDEILVGHEEERVISLAREIDEINLLKITKEAQGFTAEIIKREVELRLVNAHGNIQRSLFEAAQEAGVADAITMNMAGIFQWDIDFIQDVRIGDRFTIIYEELWRDGIKLTDGNIIAAEFINQGTPFRAARFLGVTDGTADYFTPEGLSVRKAFTRAPVDFTRISSNFDPNRRHPVLNTIRAHRGVDYAAPTGTPIKAAGDGKVIFRSARNGYGNTVILQHGGNITTLYAHMSRFASIRVGSRVTQGQTIGFVGMSGLATGPHLHYEYRVNDIHRNPRTVALPPADPISSEYREEFDNLTAPLWQQLDVHRPPEFTAVSN
ncbi:MAG: peptidase M23 [Gammaproteobacteria bacterium]|nr:peptidase M23 [Gammaproteobacteria bacterium]